MWLLSGDSIAVGLGAYLHPDALIAKVGQGSGRGASLIEHNKSKRLVVSLGANDDSKSVQSFTINVTRILQHRSCVLFLTVPNRPEFNIALRAIHSKNGHLHLVKTSDIKRSDGIHPTTAGYKKLSIRIRNKLKNC